MKIFYQQAGSKEGYLPLENAEKMLAEIPRAFKAATWAAAVDAAKHMRTVARAEARGKLDLRSAFITREDSKSGKNTYRSGINGTEATITYSGNRIPLYVFNGTSPRSDIRTDTRRPITVKGGGTIWVAPSVKAKGHQYKASPNSELKNMFVAKMPKTGHLGVFIRKEKKDESGPVWANATDKPAIEEVMGQALAQFYGKEDVSDLIKAEGAAYFDVRLKHHVERAMSGIKWWK